MAFSVGSYNNAGLAKGSLSNAHSNLDLERRLREGQANQDMKIGGIKQLMGLLGLGGGGGGLGGGLSQPGGPDGGGSGEGLGFGFDNILNNQNDQLNSLLGDISGLGEADRARIGTQYDSARNTELARLEDRGFGASNLGAEAVGSIEDARQQSLLDLSQSLLGNKIDVKQGAFQGMNDTRKGAIDAGFKQKDLDQRMMQSLLGML